MLKKLLKKLKSMRELNKTHDMILNQQKELSINCTKMN